MSIIESALHRSKAIAAGSGKSELRIDSRRASGRVESPGVATAPAPIEPSGPPVDVSPAKLIAAGLMPSDPIGARRQIDEFRTIKRPLLASVFNDLTVSADHRRASVLVTSALPHEGKSYTSLHLAMSLAREQSCEVTLIDADTPRRTLTGLLEASGNDGLLEFLCEPHRSVGSVLSPTSIPSLTFLSAGVGSGDMATELFGSPRMEVLLDELLASASRKLVVIDSAPVLVTSETPVLAKVAGQLLLVVRGNSSAQDVVLEAVSRLRSDKPMGLILNRWSPLLYAERQYYGQYYGSGDDSSSKRGENA